MPSKKSNFNRSRLRNIYEESFSWIESMLIAALCVIILFTLFFHTSGVSGSSMNDTLANNDRLLLVNAFYTPKRGDIVVLSRSDLRNEDGSTPTPIIKRVIGIGGDVVEIKDGGVYVNGEMLVEEYVKGKTYPIHNPTDNPCTVPDGFVYVLGDNREGSSDSRTKDIGLIDERYIVGKAVLRFFPFDTFGSLY